MAQGLGGMVGFDFPGEGAMCVGTVFVFLCL